MPACPDLPPASAGSASGTAAWLTLRDGHGRAGERQHLPQEVTISTSARHGESEEQQLELPGLDGSIARSGG